MGSVTSRIRCRRCGRENCFLDFYYNTGEEYIFCPDCGYSRDAFYKKDDQGTFIRKDATKGFNFSNLIPELREINDPYGAFEIKHPIGASLGTLKTETDYIKFIEDIIETVKTDSSIKKVIISRFTDGVINKEVIYES